MAVLQTAALPTWLQRQNIPYSTPHGITRLISLADEGFSIGSAGGSSASVKQPRPILYHHLQSREQSPHWLKDRLPDVASVVHDAMSHRLNRPARLALTALAHLRLIQCDRRLTVCRVARQHCHQNKNPFHPNPSMTLLESAGGLGHSMLGEFHNAQLHVTASVSGHRHPASFVASVEACLMKFMIASRDHRLLLPMENGFGIWPLPDILHT